MLNNNFNWDLTIVIPQLPCPSSIANTVSSTVDLVNSDTSDSVNLYNFAMCAFASECFSQWAGTMFWWMTKNLVTNDKYDARPAGLLNSAVQIESPRRIMSRIIRSNWKLRVHIHRSPPSIKYDLQGKVVQITNTDTFICGKYHNL